MDSETYLKQLKDKYGERRSAEFKSESGKVEQYFQAVTTRLAATYTIDKVLAVGGTGIVHLGSHKRFHQPIVLKINRPNVEAEDVSMVENEAKILPLLNHPNIIRVLDLGEMTDQTPKLTYIVEPFITGSKAFFTFDKDRVEETWLHGRIEAVKCDIPDPLKLGHGNDAGQSLGLITLLLRDVSILFSQWVHLLSHVHSVQYVYLDVKPENVLIDDHLHLTSIDYGSVEHLDHANQSPIHIFFTERYAHPKLIERKTEKESSNRVQGGLKRSELSCAFDNFALGISMLEVLNEIAKIRPHMVPQVPLYRSLHFLATRLLDGRNLAKPPHVYPHASQVFPSLRDSDYANLGYASLKDAHRDLEKERGRWNLEENIPELATYSKDMVRVLPGFNTVLTPRLRGVIEHPLVARLKHVTQLGLVALVYPTADHSRYDHALGSYTYTTYYIKSLFNDLGSPIFRNLVGTEDVNAVLLAALLHDLGQYPLAHDLEEVHPNIFKHGRIGMELLKDPTPDHRGRTLLKIIEDPNNGWNVRADTFRQILGALSKNQELTEESQKPSLKADVLSAIIDGQVDADKADYIIRDSMRCELPYGAQLDIERLFRVLTVAIISDEAAERRVTLGVYDKGLISAHAFGLARYQLLSSVYWHHTNRITKAMLQYATAMALPPAVFLPPGDERERKELEVRERLLAFVKALVPPFEVGSENPHEPAPQTETSLDLAAPPPQQVIDSLTADTAHDTDRQYPPDKMSWYPGIAWTDWLMLQWIRNLPDSSPMSRNLIHGLQARQLYKRVATFARTAPHTSIIDKLDACTWPERVDLCKKLHKSVYERLKRDWPNLDTITTISKKEFEKLCESHLLILIDIPMSRQKTGYDRPLGVVPELKEKSYQQELRQATEDKPWHDIMTNMIKGIAPVRILCHPDVRNLVSSIYEPVEREMAELLKEHLGLVGP